MVQFINTVSTKMLLMYRLAGISNSLVSGSNNFSEYFLVEGPSINHYCQDNQCIVPPPIKFQRGKRKDDRLR